MNDEDWMRKVLALAQQAEAGGSVPVAALIVKDNEIVTSVYNSPTLHDPSDHSEINCIRAYAEAHGMDYSGCTIYGVVEPCSMCLGSYLWAGTPRAVFGAYASDIAGNDYEYSDYSSSALTEHATWPFEITGGVLRDECKALFAHYKNWQKEISS